MRRGVAWVPAAGAIAVCPARTISAAHVRARPGKEAIRRPDVRTRVHVVPLGLGLALGLRGRAAQAMATRGICMRTGKHTSPQHGRAVARQRNATHMPRLEIGKSGHEPRRSIGISNNYNCKRLQADTVDTIHTTIMHIYIPAHM